VVRIEPRHEWKQKHQPESTRVRHAPAGMTEITVVIVVSREPAELLAECLGHVAPAGRRVIVIDNASPANGEQAARSGYANVDVVRLQTNRGYGAAANVGIERSAPHDVLLMNADAWPLGDAIDVLAVCLAERPEAGLVGPRLVGRDGTPQPSRFSFPTRWWTGSPAASSWPDRGRPHGATLAGPRERRRRSRFFLVGAVLLLRRAALDDVGLFDPSFFIFNEEVDLAWRMWEAGWTSDSCADSTFVHVGGSATRVEWSAMYLEQVRGHLRFLAKHQGAPVADDAWRYLRRVLRLRALVARGPVADAYREAARWLDAHPPAAAGGPAERTRAQGGRTNGNGR
jgi:N-acetylglucosaminyl-diphospho-decaprenol L-rhamnosyltransferase